MAQYVSKITDLLEGFKLVDNCTRDNINKVHEDALKETAKQRYAFGKAKTMSLSINELAVKIIQTVSFAVVGILLANGEITIGTGIATFSYVSAFLQPINSILYDVNALQSVKEVKEKYLGYIYNTLDINSKKLKELKTSITINKVNYQFDNFSLENISFNFEKGKKYAIIGHSGSGKSTVLKMIMGFFELTTGSIYIDGIPLTDIDTSELISYTDQSEHIYRDGYIENATVYNSYSINKLHQVMNEFSIKIFDIIKTKKSNENCQELSGGEKQALSFLRMLTKDASIILMDEPFSAVDIKSKEYFESYLFTNKEMNDKLLIFVTHDLGESLNRYDEVLLMRGGKIIAHDNFERLKQTSEYRAFYEQDIKDCL
jgi:ABC-type bacteriocin/lantibiotic exporter with double-glycine peptidase domain